MAQLSNYSSKERKEDQASSRGRVAERKRGKRVRGGGEGL